MALLAGHCRGAGEAEFAQMTFEQLAEGRGFHAYLAATTLAKPLSLGMAPDAAEETITGSHAVVARVSELLALGMEWEGANRVSLVGLMTHQIALSLAELAAESGRHSWAIEAAAAAGAWGGWIYVFPWYSRTSLKMPPRSRGCLSRLS